MKSENSGVFTENRRRVLFSPNAIAFHSRSRIIIDSCINRTCPEFKVPFPFLSTAFPAFAINIFNSPNDVFISRPFCYAVEAGEEEEKQNLRIKG